MVAKETNNHNPILSGYQQVIRATINVLLLSHHNDNLFFCVI